MVLCKLNIMVLNVYKDIYGMCGIMLKSHRHVCKMGALEEGMHIHQRVVESKSGELVKNTNLGNYLTRCNC